MNWTKRISRRLRLIAIVSCICILTVGVWLWANPVQYRSTVIEFGSQRQADPAANAYVHSAPDDMQITKLLIADRRFGQLQTIAMKPNPDSWLRSHLHIRKIQDNRLEISAKARTFDVSAQDMDSLVAFASESLIADPADNGLGARVHSTMRAGG